MEYDIEYYERVFERITIFTEILYGVIIVDVIAHLAQTILEPLIHTSELLFLATALAVIVDDWLRYTIYRYDLWLSIEREYRQRHNILSILITMIILDTIMLIIYYVSITTMTVYSNIILAYMALSMFYTVSLVWTLHLFKELDYIDIACIVLFLVQSIILSQVVRSSITISIVQTIFLAMYIIVKTIEWRIIMREH